MDEQRPPWYSASSLGPALLVFVLMLLCEGVILLVGHLLMGSSGGD